MNNSQLQFTSGTPIGEQEKIIIKKLQVKINEVLGKKESTEEVYDKGSCLIINLSPSELYEGIQRKDSIRILAEKLFNLECVTQYTSPDTGRRLSRSTLFFSVDECSSKGIKFIIHRSVVENIFQSSDFSDMINETAK